MKEKEKSLAALEGERKRRGRCVGEEGGRKVENLAERLRGPKLFGGGEKDARETLLSVA